MVGFLIDAWCGGMTSLERAVLVWERASTWNTRLPGLVLGQERRMPTELKAALRPVSFVGASAELGGTLVARPGTREGILEQSMEAGGWLHTLALGAGRIVVTSSWRGTAEGVLTTKELNGERVGSRFGCRRTPLGEEATVAEGEMKWIPLQAEEREFLRPGHKVAAEGQRQWRLILTEAVDGQCDTTYLCKGNRKFGQLAVEDVVALKVERLPVYSIEGISVAMRQHEGQHCSPLFLDDRGEKEVVRRLYGDEVWRVQGFPLELLRDLVKSGVSTEECGAHAAGEVPQRMADVIVETVIARLRMKLEEGSEPEAEVMLPWLIPDAPRVEHRRMSLLVVKLGRGPAELPRVLCCRGHEETWMVGGSLLSRQGGGEGCLKKAQSWADQLVIGSAEPFQHSRDGDRDRIDVVCLLPCEGLLREEQRASYVWRTLKELGSGCVFMLAANAVGLALTFTSRIGRCLQESGLGDGAEEEERARWRTAQEEILFAAHKSGSLTAKLVDSRLGVEDQVGSWGSLMKEDAVARDALKVAMTRAALALGQEESQALGEWADRITPIDMLDLPEGLADEWRGFGQERLQEQEFVTRCGQARSDSLPLAKAQGAAPVGFHPQSTEELFEPWAWMALQAWIRKQLDFLKDIRKRGTDAVRQSNETLALGAEALVLAARGTWWDCRGDKPKPLDVEHVEGSHINFELLVEEGDRWGIDKELTDMFRFGFSYKAGLEMQVVGCPHLVSLKENYERLVDDTLSMALKEETSRFFEISQCIQFVPCRLGSKGSADKDGYYADGKPKKRPTNEGGAPRKETKDTSGRPVRPINVATEDTASHPAWSEFQKWAHEGKPRISDLLVALAIFLHLALQLGIGWAVYTFGDDCSMFFNQFRTRTEQWPFTTFLMDDGEGNPLFVLEKGMTFGPSKASQLAQRIANFIIDMFCRRMDEMDAPFVEEEAKSALR